MALQIIEPKRKTDNGHHVISGTEGGYEAVDESLRRMARQTLLWGVEVFFFIKRTDKRLSAKTLDTLVTFESAVRLLNRCVACAVAYILGKE